ncbi:MAG: ATP-binding cassette domain-containing protein, partial [Bdellovibrionota bacterium]
QVHFYILMAPNCAGKSTALRLIMGLERPTTGTMSFLGKDHDQDGIPSAVRGQIGLVAETVEYDPSASLMRFLKFYATLFPLYDLPWLCAMAQVRNIDLTQKFHKLSRGQKMQIILLAELAKRPKLLLIDEITSVLDPYSRAFYLNLLSDFTARGGTILLTTNVIHEVESSASDLLILKSGTVAWKSPIDTIFQQFTKIMVSDPLTDEALTCFKQAEFYPLDRLRSEGRWMSVMVGPTASLPLITTSYVQIHMGAEDLFKYFFQTSSDAKVESKAMGHDLRAA